MVAGSNSKSSPEVIYESPDGGWTSKRGPNGSSKAQQRDPDDEKYLSIVRR